MTLELQTNFAIVWGGPRCINDGYKIYKMGNTHNCYITDIDYTVRWELYSITLCNALLNSVLRFGNMNGMPVGYQPERYLEITDKMENLKPPSAQDPPGVRLNHQVSFVEFCSGRVVYKHKKKWFINVHWCNNWTYLRCKKKCIVVHIMCVCEVIVLVAQSIPINKPNKPM